MIGLLRILLAFVTGVIAAVMWLDRRPAPQRLPRAAPPPVAPTPAAEAPPAPEPYVEPPAAPDPQLAARIAELERELAQERALRVPEPGEAPPGTSAIRAARVRALRRIGELLNDETRMLGGMLRPTIAPFELIAGVPIGGLHAATAFSLASNVPMIYVHPPSQARHVEEEIEGAYYPGQTVILVDDLMTRGGSLSETADLLRSAGLMVHDAFVLIDRGAGGVERMRREGVTVHSLLTLEGLLNYLLSRELITQAIYAKCLTWLEGVRGGEDWGAR